MTLTMLWKNHRKTLINLPWKYHESNSTHFCFPIFGWLISSKSENFDAVAIHQFWSKWPQTKPKWLILVCFTTNFVPKRYFFELRCPTGQWPHLPRSCWHLRLLPPGDWLWNVRCLWSLRLCCWSCSPWFSLSTEVVIVVGLLLFCCGPLATALFPSQ